MTGRDPGGGFTALHPVVQHHVVNTLHWPALRPLQEFAVAPLLAGDDALLLAPTAGGKTEAALLPLLTRVAVKSWGATSILYVCPLKALLNNLAPRVQEYASWLGLTAQVRHGDTTATVRKRQLVDPPDILLTTPESLESMLVSPSVDERRAFASVRAVIADEVHAFAGDDRGWHLLAVLERIARIAGRPLQRVGLSATVGNAPDLLHWFQGGNAARGIPASVVAPHLTAADPAPATDTPDLELDHVGTVDNAAIIISALHRGEKRLVFADSRRTVEELAIGLRERGVQTFVSHSSLSLDERRRAEAAFAEARDCVIVSTSTLELGIDVGDLDRVIQVGAPRAVASVLQRLGRTGRRPGSRRNMLFLEADDTAFLRASALLMLMSEGFVEPVRPPAVPRHILAQQLIGTVLQEGRLGDTAWQDRFDHLPLAPADELPEILAWQLDQGHLDRDGGMLHIGPEAERRYGQVHYRDLMAVFTAAPEFTVLHGRAEVGSIDPTELTRKVEGPRRLTLAARAWLVTHIDWRRRTVYVEPSDTGSAPRWSSGAQHYPGPLAQAVRRVLLGTDPAGVPLTPRAEDKLAQLRKEFSGRVHDERTVLVGGRSDARWWTWAGGRANAVLGAALHEVAPALAPRSDRFDSFSIELAVGTTAVEVSDAMTTARDRFGSDLRGILPAVDEKAVHQLKFAEMLPPRLAVATLALRGADHDGAAAVTMPVQAPAEC